MRYIDGYCYNREAMGLFDLRLKVNMPMHGLSGVNLVDNESPRFE